MSEYQADCSNKCFCRSDVTDYSTKTPRVTNRGFVTVSDKIKYCQSLLLYVPFRHFKVWYIKV